MERMERIKFTSEEEKRLSGTREEAKEELERFGVHVPESIIEGKKDERTYFDEFANMREKMKEMAEQIINSKGADRRNLLKERDQLFIREVELTRRMRTGIFTDSQHEHMQKSWKEWSDLVDRMIIEKPMKKEN